MGADDLDAKGPGCGAEVPLMRSLWLAKKKGKGQALRWVRNDMGEVQTQTVRKVFADGLSARFGSLCWSFSSQATRRQWRGNRQAAARRLAL